MADLGRKPRTRRYPNSGLARDRFICHRYVMTVDLLGALAAFAFVSSITPGPNNLMLMASGANFGMSRSLPHMMGVAVGFTVMIVLVGIGLMQIFDLWPPSYDILKYGSVIYLLWLAWKIANAGEPGRAKSPTGSPITFWQAAAFQWVNPKAWAMALTAIAAYAPARDLGGVLMVSAVFGAINLPSISAWTMMGQQIRRILTSPGRLRLFNWTMAALLILSVLPVIFAAS